MMAAAAIAGSRVKIAGLNTATPRQPDMEILRILSGMGVGLVSDKNCIEVISQELKGLKIDARNIPDLVPICAALACYAEGRTLIYNAGRLRIKESDRLTATSSELMKMGARISETEDTLEIEGPCKLRGTTIDPHADHRIAMACTVAALKAEGMTRIIDADCVSKSYPNFFKDLEKLGGNVRVG
jgi:3-phosphoshikimate 1-carboxyvinyltransferase